MASEIAEPVAATETSPLLCSKSIEEHSKHRSSLTASPDGLQHGAIPEVSLTNEASILVRYSGPLVVTYFLQYVYQLVIIGVAAQLSTEEIAGVSLGITTSNITGYALFEGFATALDTLCSQAYGSRRLTDVGLYTIRGTILVHLAAVLPVGTLWLCSSYIFERLVPQPELVEHASSFLYWTLIGVPGYCAFENGKRFMQAQGNFNAGLAVLVVSLPINLALTYYLTIVADMRVAGAALASSLTILLRPILLAGYGMVIDRSTLQCWPSAREIREGWSKDWSLVMRLAIPGVLMNLSEWLCFEIMTFATAYVSTAALAAQTFLATTTTIVWHIPFSASIACSTRIGQLVGAGMPATKVMQWYAYVFASIGALDAAATVGIVLLMLKTVVHDPDVASIMLETLPFVALFTVFESSSNWPHAIVRGFGWQDIGAWCTVTINYLYGVPLSVFLELGPPKLGIRGIWIGLGSALALTTVVEAFVIWLRLRKTTNGGFLADIDSESSSDD